jgi:hypothetical protein
LATGQQNRVAKILNPKGKTHTELEWILLVLTEDSSNQGIGEYQKQNGRTIIFLQNQKLQVPRSTLIQLRIRDLSSGNKHEKTGTGVR